MKPDSIKLVKHRPIFNTVQGEGDLVGTRATFLRTFGCNLDCPWCDTSYSWKPGVPNFGGEVWDFDSIMLELRVQGIQPYMVVTGGEPTLQIKALTSFVEYARDQFKSNVPHFTIETNGTRYDDGLKHFDLISCSPKPWRFDKDMTALGKIMTMVGSQVQLKIVVQNLTEIIATASLLWAMSSYINRGSVSVIIQPETSKGPEWFREVVRIIVQHKEVSFPKIRKFRILPQVHALLGVE